VYVSALKRQIQFAAGLKPLLGFEIIFFAKERKLSQSRSFAGASYNKHNKNAATGFGPENRRVLF
jgi:hypothetical protein